MASSRVDSSSQSNFGEAWAKHCALDLTIDFASREIRGSATYDVESVADKFVVDTSGKMRIFEVRVDGVAVETEEKVDDVLGVAVSVPVPKGRCCKVRFNYATGSECSAAQWLDMEQTADGSAPYLFTQCQAIHCRSLIPIQDSPGAKLTWEARVSAPYKVLMSGLESGGSWRQDRKVSPYLIALVCGSLESRDISPRCRVWAEQSVVQKAAEDFADAELFLRAAEETTGLDYPWTRYDFVCLPPSFPYGGMENANLTFVTPTLLSGDRSLAGVVAHEIAHSWTGNWVTNATWAHFWLNEGWTRWLERQIKTRVSNDPEYVDFDLGRSRRDLSNFVAGAKRYTELVPDLDGVDPDDAFSIVPYEKGSGLLHFIEYQVGRQEFLAFARNYLSHFRDSTVTSADFRQFVSKHLPNVDVDWDSWFFASGDIPQSFPLSTKAVDKVEAILEKWRARDYVDISTLSIDLKIYFLDHVPFTEELYKYDFSNNSELFFRFCKILLKARQQKGVFEALHMATSQGRMKFVRPLYKTLYDCEIPKAKEAAVATFLAHRHFYHPICRKMVALDLGLSKCDDDAPPKKRQLCGIALLGISLALLGATLFAKKRRS